MAMFEELFALAQHATLTLIVSADAGGGTMTVSVLPKPKEDHGEMALRQPLSLTATPQEFDAEFVATLRGYRQARDTLAEQAAATREVLDAAKSASVKKASEVASAASKPKAAAPAPNAAAPAAPAGATAARAASETGVAADAPQAMDLFG